VIKNLSDYFSDFPPAEPLQFNTSINMSLSSCVSNGEHNNADDDVSRGSTDGLTSNQLSHISILPLADAKNLFNGPW